MVRRETLLLLGPYIVLNFAFISFLHIASPRIILSDPFSTAVVYCPCTCIPGNGMQDPL